MLSTLKDDKKLGSFLIDKSKSHFTNSAPEFSYQGSFQWR